MKGGGEPVLAAPPVSRLVSGVGIAPAQRGVALVARGGDAPLPHRLADGAAGLVQMGAVGVEAAAETARELREPEVQLRRLDPLQRQRANARRVGNVGSRLVLDPAQDRRRRRVPPLAGRRRDVGHVSPPLRVEPVQQARLADAGRSGHRGHLAPQSLLQVRHALPGDGREVQHRVPRFVGREAGTSG